MAPEGRLLDDHIDAWPDADCPRHRLIAGESVLAAIDMPIELAGVRHRHLYEEIKTDDPDDRINL